MSSQLITFPDTVTDNKVSVLLVMPTPDTLELVVAACRNYQTDFNIYVTGAEEDADWISKTMLLVDKIFKNPDPTEVCAYLESKETESYTEL
jgi:hypothetical protein